MSGGGSFREVGGDRQDRGAVKRSIGSNVDHQIGSNRVGLNVMGSDRIGSNQGEARKVYFGPSHNNVRVYFEMLVGLSLSLSLSSILP